MSDQPCSSSVRRSQRPAETTGAVTNRKVVADGAARLADLERRVAALEKQLKLDSTPALVPWWVRAYPNAYRRNGNG